MSQPWRSAGLAVALVASFAAPALMAASAGMFMQSAADTVTRELVEEDPGRSGLTVAATGVLQPGAVDALDREVTDELARNGRLGPPTRTVFASQVGLFRPAPGADEQAEPIIGSSGTLLQREGAIDALEPVVGDPATAGVWISQRSADRLELDVGDVVSIEGGAELPVAGIYENLWEGERDPYWDGLPAPLVPRFSSVFNGPLFELYVVPAGVLDDLSIDAGVRWDAELVDPPRTQAALDELTGAYRAVERSFTESPSMAAAVAGFSGPGGSTPSTATDAFDLRRRAEGIIDGLRQPIGTTAVAGVLLGLMITGAGAVFAVRRRRTEFRLLRSDGDAGWRFAVRALVQYTPPALVGAALGVGAAVALVGALGPSRIVSVSAIGVEAVGLALGAGLLVAAVATMVLAVRVLDPPGPPAAPLRIGWLLLVIGLASAAWIQVGSASQSREVDLLVVGFPLVGLVAGVGLVSVTTRWLMRRVHRTGASLPTALFLAWRRITAAELGSLLVSAAMGVALGLVVFSAVLVDSLETAAAAKTTTVVGGTAQVRVLTRGGFEAPQESTVIRRQTTLLTVGDGRVDVLAVDPDTYATGVSWHPTFGSSPEELLRMLDEPVDADVAAVVVGDREVPLDGGFGTSDVISYAVVGDVAAAPLASAVSPTLVVREDQLEAVGRRLHELGRPDDVSADEWAEEYRSPIERAARLLVSQEPIDAVTQELDAQEIEYRDVRTASEERDLIGNRAVRWTFEYLRLLAVVAASAAVGALLFHLSAQRAARRRSTAMAIRMGLRRSTAQLSSMLELIGLVVLALAAGTSAALVLAARVFARFEPDPRVPPTVGIQQSIPIMLSIVVVTFVVVIAASVASQRSAHRQPFGEVLRAS